MGWLSSLHEWFTTPAERVGSDGTGRFSRDWAKDVTAMSEKQEVRAIHELVAKRIKEQLDSNGEA